MWQIAMLNWLPVIVAQAEADAAHEPRQMSYLAWVYHSLGLMYSLALPLAGLMVFLGAVLVVILAIRRPGVIAAYLVFVPLPLLIGVFGTVDGLIRSHSVIAMADYAPKPSEVSQGYSMALLCLLVGMLATAPGYFVTALGLFLSAILNKPRAP
jgi:di/tricarboxylate transporter